VVEYFERTGNARVQFRWQKIRDLATPTPTRTNTPTNTPTSEPSITPTSTPTSAPTVTPSPTATPTQVPVTVTLQEGVEGYEGTADTFVSRWAQRANHGDLDHLWIREGGIKTGLVRFDLSGVFSGPIEEVQAAVLTLRVLERTNENPVEIMAYRVLVPWEELEANWRAVSPGVPWDTPGCKGDGVDREAEAFTRGEVNQTDYDFELDVTAAVAAWAADPTANFGIVLDAEGPVQVRYSFASSEYATLEWRPELSITYTSSPGPTKVEAGPTELPPGSPDTISDLIAQKSLVLPRTSLRGGVFE
jgi:hypothetical protein